MLRTFGPVLAIFAASFLVNFALAEDVPFDPAYETGWEFYRGHFYKMILAKTRVYRNQAQLICQDLSSTLVKPKDQEEFNFIATLAEHLRPESWDDCPLIGIHQAESAKWRFVDRFLPWCDGEPTHSSIYTILIYNYADRRTTHKGPCIGVRTSDADFKYFICKSV